MLVKLLKVVPSIFAVVFIGCGADNVAVVQRHTDNITDYVYDQSYGNSLTYNERYNLEVVIKSELEKAVRTSAGSRQKIDSP